jgi:hypothetical protein
MKHSIGLALVAGLCLAACVVEEEPELAEVDQEVMGGVDEPDYRYPWVVRVESALTCSGVLIAPNWVLTAGHCVSTLTTPTVSYWRTDAYSGDMFGDERVGVANSVHGVYPHPNCCTNLRDDLALIRLSQPFTLGRYIQTIALPTSGPPATNTMVSAAGLTRHDGTLPSGQVAVVRAPVVSGVCALGAGEFCVQEDDAAFCATDSGSGIVRNVGATLTTNGRATALGVASSVPHAQCDGDDYGQSLTVEDVYSHRIWISQTTGISLTSFAGDARAHYDGQPSRGSITVRCESSPWGTVTTSTVTPMNAPGAEARLDCPWNNRMRVTCNLGGDPAAQITSLKVTTTNLSNGTVTTSTIQPSSPNSATYTSPYDLSGTIVRDVACRVSGVSAP